MDKPILLVDIDGVISLFGFDHARPPGGRFVMVDGITHYLSAAAGPQLSRLAEAFELAWCSGWEEKANEHLPHALDLPGPLPYLDFGERIHARRAHWKLEGIERYAGPTRPLAWIDDAHDEHSRAWAAERPGPTLLIDTEPSSGLTDAHVAKLLRWAADPAVQVTGGRS